MTSARIAALVGLGLALALAAALVALAAPAAFAASGSYTGGVTAADSATYVANDHTVTAVRFSASAGLATSTTYYVKIRFSPSTGPVSGANRGFIWNSTTSQWVQSDDATWADFPSITTDSSGLITTNSWYYVKFGDTRLSGTYHWIVSLNPGASGSTLNGSSAPAVTVLDMTATSGGGFWVHNGVATGLTGAKRAESVAGGTTTLWSLQRTEPNLCDDNADGILDNEDYGPAGTAGDFRLAVPAGLAFDVLLQGTTIWPTGASSFTGATSDVDIAYGASNQTPPDTPTGLSATAHNASVALSWTAATDDVGVTGYTIYRWVDLGLAVETAPAVVIGTTTETTYTDATVANDTTYHYLVRAHDAATNEGPRSNEATATPDGTPPGPVTGATFTPGDQAASIAWTNPGDPDWSATTVVRNDSHQPADAADGTAVYSGAGTAYDDSSLSNGATYYYGIFARDAAGNWSSGVFGSVVPRGATMLTLTPPLLVVPWRGAVQLSGQLSTDGAPLGGKQVVLESSPDGSVWSWVADLPSADGSYSVLAAAHLRQKTMYRLRFPGDVDFAGSQSAPVTVTPHVLLGTPSAPLRVRHGVAFTSTGTLQPRHPAGQRSVRILCYKLRSGTWVLKLTVNAANLNYSTYSKYRARFALPSAGRWRLRAYHPADALHAATKSAYRYLTVT
jgi:hypothetical protein